MTKVTHPEDTERTAKTVGQIILYPGECRQIMERYMKKSGGHFNALSTTILKYKDDRPYIFVVSVKLPEDFVEQTSIIS